MPRAVIDTQEEGSGLTRVDRILAEARTRHLPEIQSKLKRRQKPGAELSLPQILLRARLAALRGDPAASHRILSRLAANSNSDVDTFLGITSTALFCMQFELAREIAVQRHPLLQGMEIVLGKDGAPPVIYWHVNDAGQFRFEFPPRLWWSSGPPFGRWATILPLFEAFRRAAPPVVGSVAVNLGDGGDVPGLGFCSTSPHVTLVPDARYIKEAGYVDAAKALDAADIPWDQKVPMAFWRGSLSGKIRGSWESLPRVQLSKIGLTPAGQEVLDVAVTRVGRRKIDLAELERAGVLRPVTPLTEVMRFKYQIDIDGNTNAWKSMFMKLRSGVPVLKVASPEGYRQWYYDRLIPWVNYVPVASDMSDLVQAVHWLREHDDKARAIGQAGKELALSLDYPGELERAVPAIAKAMQPE